MHLLMVVFLPSQHRSIQQENIRFPMCYVRCFILHTVIRRRFSSHLRNLFLHSSRILTLGLFLSEMLVYSTFSKMIPTHEGRFSSVRLPFHFSRIHSQILHWMRIQDFSRSQKIHPRENIHSSTKSVKLLLRHTVPPLPSLLPSPLPRSVAIQGQ